ncbi:hypothetical protein Leryth_012010 [Lithospermum erythrorhizon]|nr:hypothetical protein Leryth_012010 [Lithospermum erythrorhizon]
MKQNCEILLTLDCAAAEFSLLSSSFIEFQQLGLRKLIIIYLVLLKICSFIKAPFWGFKDRIFL